MQLAISLTLFNEQILYAGPLLKTLFVRDTVSWSCLSRDRDFLSAHLTSMLISTYFYNHLSHIHEFGAVGSNMQKYVLGIGNANVPYES